MSAPAQNQNGLPVKTAATQSPTSSSASSACPDSNAERPSDGGFVQSSPLSIVTSARRPAFVSTARRWKTCQNISPFPHDRGAHPQADAERREAVAGVGTLAHRVRELGYEPDAGSGERVTARDGAAVPVQALVLSVDPQLPAPREHLHGKGLVDLEEVDVVE